MVCDRAAGLVSTRLRSRGTGDNDFRLDGSVFHLRVDEGRVVTRWRAREGRGLIIETDSESLFALLTGQGQATDAVAAGTVKIAGGLDELQKMIGLFALRQAELTGARP